MTTERKCPFTVNIAETENQLAKKLSDVLKQCSDQAIESRKTFRVGLSGKLLVSCMCACARDCLRVHVRDKLNLR